MKKLICLLLAMCMAFALAACGAKRTEKPAATPEPTPAQPAETPGSSPAKAVAETGDLIFRTVDMDGNAWDESCFADAKLTMLNLWAYWCPPCVGEMPDLQRLADDYADRGLRVIGVYDGAEEAQDRAKAEELGVSYPNIRYHEAFDPWMATGYIPVTVFVDGGGKVLGEACIGGRSYGDWALIIEEYLK